MSKGKVGGAGFPKNPQKGVMVIVEIPEEINNYIEGLQAAAKSLPYVRIDKRSENKQYRNVPSKKEILLDMIQESFQERIEKLSNLEPIE